MGKDAKAAADAVVGTKDTPRKSCLLKESSKSEKKG